jgi:hypothetical protein
MKVGERPQTPPMVSNAVSGSEGIVVSWELQCFSRGALVIELGSDVIASFLRVTMFLHVADRRRELPLARRFLGR